MKPCLFLLLCLPLPALAQQRADHTWLIGVRTETVPGYPHNCMNVLDFNGGELDIRRDTFQSEMFVTNASISDDDGSLLFYTNGCYVKNAAHEVMPNGGHLNPGFIYDDNCPDYGYTTPSGAIILPLGTNENTFHLLHQAIDVFDSPPYVRVNRLYRTTVDMSLDGGKGDVTAKNEPVLTSQLHTGLQAVRHADGEGWWVVVMGHSKYEMYKILLAPDGGVTVDSQLIAPYLHSGSIGQMAFSPDGNQLAYYDFLNQLSIFDFDRNTGLLGNHQHYEIPTDTPFIVINGLSYSPNGRFLYLLAPEQLYQLDLESSDIPASAVKVGEYDGFTFDSVYNFRVRFFRMQPGPDCKIYLSPYAPAPYLHVIHRPDEPGLACGFEQHAIELPCSANYSVPTFPNYRLGTPYPYCDSSIVYSAGPVRPLPVGGRALVFPSPADGQVQVVLPGPLPVPAAWVLYDQLGREVLREVLPAGNGSATVGLPALPPGLYYWAVEAGGRMAGNGKLVVAGR